MMYNVCQTYRAEDDDDVSLSALYDNAADAMRCFKVLSQQHQDNPEVSICMCSVCDIDVCCDEEYLPEVEETTNKKKKTIN